MIGEKKKAIFSRISFDCVAFFMVFASLLTLHWFAKCNCKLTTEGYLLKDVIRTHTKGIAFSVIFSFTFVKFLLRKGVWCARMFALVFGSRVCEGCVCRYILCQCGQPMGGYTNAQQYTCWWRGWHFKHRKVDLFIGESDISNVLKLHYSLKIIFGELQSALLCWNCIMAWAKLGHATIFGRN